MNTFDYKQKVYGWDKQTFDDYNKSRAVTKENLVKKYGKDIGIHRWNEYLQKQHYSKTLDYLIEKYGEEKGLEEYKRICREKLLTKENFIRKYGEIDGIAKWKSYLDGISCGYSKTAIKFIEKIVHANKEDHKLFYGENEKKFDIFENGFTYVLVDLYDETTNKVIEFYGDFWHANPLIYKEDAKDFFRRMSFKYKNYPNVIYEICNEPNGNVTWNENVKPYAEEVISVIRENSKDRTVISKGFLHK